MSLGIIKQGLLDTIQDAGRYGFQYLGINPGGAMDTVAMQVANILVGNDPSEAVIEMHFPAAEIAFGETVLIALAGADLSASVDGTEIPILHPVIIQKNAVLRFGKRKTGARIYLAVKDGIAANEWLQSKSTHLKVKAGGMNGRVLQKNDRISILAKEAGLLMSKEHTCEILPWRAKVADLYGSNQFHFIAGNEYSLLDDLSKQRLEKENFKISPESDRMGYRLRGTSLQTTTKKEMISTAITRGTMQLLPGGQLILLMADHQTTGGYPRIAHIISADLPSLAQLQAGESFSLQCITVSEAEKLFATQQMNLQQLRNACNFRLQNYFNK
jgi:antagonist of KipI